ncbi:MAG: 2-hydroxyacyl-CoA dehydratase [Bradymonadales bacterium]|nr:2-hydroxyacyl-CoA dehydratase [Bradymonadales bacterium]
MVPRPILSAGGLFPVRLRSPEVMGTPLADTYLSSVTCQYVRALLELAMEDRFSDLDGWVFAASCDHLRRLADNLLHVAPPNFLHVLDVPHRVGEEAITWLADELRNLCVKMEHQFGVDLSDEALTKAIWRENEVLSRLERIGRLRRDDPPALFGTDFHRLLAAWQVTPPAWFANTLGSLENALDSSTDRPPARARLMVCGSQIDQPRWIEVVESVGTVIVADRFCFGSIPGLEPWPVGVDPIRSMAEWLLVGSACPRMMERFDSRLERIQQVVREYRVDGVVVQSLKFCDLWGIELAALTRALRELGIPVLRLEREYGGGGEGQLRTRVQAFLESMGR